MLMCPRHHHIEGLTKDSSRNYGYAMYEKYKVNDKPRHLQRRLVWVFCVQAGCPLARPFYQIGRGMVHWSSQTMVMFIVCAALHRIPDLHKKFASISLVCLCTQQNSSSFCAKPQCSLEYTLKTLPAQHRAQNTMKQSMGYLQGRFTCQDNCQLDQKRGTDPRGLLQTRFLIKSNF